MFRFFVIPLLYFIFFLSSNTLLANGFFDNYTSGIESFLNISTINGYGVLRKGSFLVFNTYSGFNIANKNKITFLKPQSIIMVIGKVKGMPFYLVENDSLFGLIKDDCFTFINKENLDIFLNFDSVFLRKPLMINDILFPIGTEVKYRKKSKDFYEVCIWDNGFFRAYISSKSVVHKLKPTLKNYKFVSQFFNGYPYFWAGSEEGWDCSLLVKDFFKFFDINFPRNSYQQIKSVNNIDVSGMSLKSKIKILKKAKPFETLLYFPGHIMIYAGFKGKEPMSFQAVNRFNNKHFGRVGFFPLKRTGLLNKVTRIGFIKIDNKLDLTINKSEGRIQCMN